jgi:hypothetical protein
VTMPETKISLDDSLSKLFSLAGDDYDGMKDVWTIWETKIDADGNVLGQLYDRYFATLRELLDDPAKESGSRNDLSDVQAHRFITTFVSSNYLGSERKQAWRLLQERHAEHVPLIMKALARPNYEITSCHLRTDTGYWGDIVGAMLEIYGWHKPYDVQDDPLLTDMVSFIPEFYRAFPEQDNFILVNRLQLHPDALAQFVSLIRFHVLDRGDGDEGPMKSLAGNMMGFYADKKDFAHANSAKIFAGVLKDAEDWPAEAVRSLIEKFVLTPLAINPYTQAQASERMRENIKVQQRLLAKASDERQKQRGKEYLAEYEAELAAIEGDFGGWNTRRRSKAIQRIAVSSSTRKAIATVVQKVPAVNRAILKSLLDEADTYANRPKRFPMPKPSDNRFKDFGLKLLVIEELMYRQQVLQPVFDIHVFASEYEKREVSVETEGYDVIPEAAQYFRNLAISDDLLARVEALHQSSGLDGGPKYIDHFFPFWDPGVGDGPVKVTNRAADDLVLLPNLRRMTGLENSKPGRALLKALNDRGIELLNEDD